VEEGKKRFRIEGCRIPCLLPPHPITAGRRADGAAASGDSQADHTAHDATFRPKSHYDKTGDGTEKQDEV
jgi:hypothetical protein